MIDVVHSVTIKISVGSIPHGTGKMKNYAAQLTFHGLFQKWLWTTHLTNSSSGVLCPRKHAFRVKEGLVCAVRYELLNFISVHVISPARWRHNPQAVSAEFSLACFAGEELHIQRCHTARAGCCSTSSPCRCTHKIMIEHFGDALDFLMGPLAEKAEMLLWVKRFIFSLQCALKSTSPFFCYTCAESSTRSSHLSGTWQLTAHIHAVFVFSCLPTTPAHCASCF